MNEEPNAGKARSAKTHLRGKTRTYRMSRFRWLIQAAFALIWLGPFIGAFHWICGPVFHCYACPLSLVSCPIGVMAQFSALHVFPFIALGTVLAVGATFGALVCGWMCPFGFIQDIAARISKPKMRLPAWTGHLRYVVLVGLVFVVPFFWGKESPLFICRVCPAGALEGTVPYTAGQLWRAEGPDTSTANALASTDAALAGTLAQASDEAAAVLWPGPVKITILVLFLVLIFVKFRPWCTLFCPLGAIFSLMNRASLFFLKFHPSRCTNCGACETLCKCDVSPRGRANDPRCIRCLECTHCGALTVDNAARPSKSED